MADQVDDGHAGGSGLIDEPTPQETVDLSLRLIHGALDRRPQQLEGPTGFVHPFVDETQVLLTGAVVEAPHSDRQDQDAVGSAHPG
ncbi:hypothetical protein [Streptomyces sp. NPDC007991]|uniref:hypothetical protein n=1 Tax=Streptomyces sp. NPDC007991 TaxID=3364803 RepID=UPI0036E5E645